MVFHHLLAISSKVTFSEVPSFDQVSQNHLFKSTIFSPSLPKSPLEKYHHLTKLSQVTFSKVPSFLEVTFFEKVLVGFVQVVWMFDRILTASFRKLAFTKWCLNPCSVLSLTYSNRLKLSRSYSFKIVGFVVCSASFQFFSPVGNFLTTKLLWVKDKKSCCFWSSFCDAGEDT